MKKQVKKPGIFKTEPVYRCFIGTGGIGTGRFFELRGNNTLGREESRMGHFLDRRDYCKLHIVSHYVSVLMGSAVVVYPLGMVGDDEEGNRLLAEMKEADIKLDFVKKIHGRSTLFSFCFIYPDGTGGNMTTDDSASSIVNPSYIKSTELLFERYRKNGIACALPEVPVEARYELLKLGRSYGFYNVASFTSDEIKWAIQNNVIEYIDLIGLNSDEAYSLINSIHNKREQRENILFLKRSTDSGLSLRELTNKSLDLSIFCENLFKISLDFLKDLYPEVGLTVTCGKAGSWSWDGNIATHLKPPDVLVQGTSGAGDAFLAGVICGIFAGLSLSEAHHLGNLLSAMAVTSPHTINFDITPGSFLDFLKKGKLDIPLSIKEKLRV